MRHKPKYNNQYLIYEDKDGNQTGFYCNELHNNKQIEMLINQPVKDGGSKFITDSDIDFAINGKIIQGDVTYRIQSLPDIIPRSTDNNSRRGYFRKDKVIITS